VERHLVSLFSSRGGVVNFSELLILIPTISPRPHVPLAGNRLKHKRLRAGAMLDGDMFYYSSKQRCSKGCYSHVTSVIQLSSVCGFQTFISLSHPVPLIWGPERPTVAGRKIHIHTYIFNALSTLKHRNGSQCESEIKLIQLMLEPLTSIILTIILTVWRWRWNRSPAYATKY
jgi:hypothetical protein